MADTITGLSGREGYRARLRSPDNTVKYIPLTNATGYYQCSYLDSASQTRRAGIAADIEYRAEWYTLVDFQLRNSDKCRAGLIRKVSGGYLLTGELGVLLKRLAGEKGVWSNANLTAPRLKLKL